MGYFPKESQTNREVFASPSRALANPDRKSCISGGPPNKSWEAI
jgi:hypothetical protein